MIQILRQKATQQQVAEMLEELDPLIKLAVDIRRGILAGGGQMHADCESVLIKRRQSSGKYLGCKLDSGQVNH